MTPSSHRRHTLLQVGVLVAAYYGTAKLGLSFGFLNGNVTPIWPPTGVALAALVLFGVRLWPGVAIGALLVNGLSPVPFASATGMAAGNTFEAVAGAMLLSRIGFHPSLRRVRDVLALLGAGAVLSTIVSATVGVTSLRLGGVIPSGATWPTWRIWWVGDALGDLIVAPILLVWGAGRLARGRGTARQSDKQRSTVEAALLGAALGAVSIVVFSSPGGTPYLVFPIMVWAAVRFTQRGTAMAVVGVALTSIVHTAHGYGPFARASTTDALALLDTFLAMVAITGLVLAAVVSERDRAQRELRETNASLDARTRVQTEELRLDRERLSEAQRLAKLGSWEWDIASDTITWSDELYRLYGLEPGEFSPTYATYLSRVHPDDRSLAESVVNRCYATLEPFEFEHRVILASGHIRWLHGSGRAIPGADGVPVKMVGTALDITASRRAEDALAYQAGHDPLTSLPNRSLFFDRLAHALTRRGRRSDPAAVLFLDIDRFKWLNDSLGHSAGDQLLVEVAARLQAAARSGDTVARFGGDEFVVLCEDLDDDLDAVTAARRFAQAISTPVVLQGIEITPTVSIGIAVSTDESASADSLLRDADAAMYQAKDRGRDRCEVFDENMRARATERLEIENALRHGIEHGELIVYYQPQIDLATGKAAGLEALARWNHPERGLVLPADFIPRAEETSLIVPLGLSILTQACRQVAEWHGRAPSDRPSVTVNLSPRQLASPGLCEAVSGALQDSGLPPEALCLEITESIFLDDADIYGKAVRSLKDLGVQIGVDDFGTGYSSLTYLRQFPVDVLKIDKSFVDGLGRDIRDKTIVASIIDLAHAFGLTTVAEGVETAEQLTQLRELGCEAAQGYLWSRPLPAEDVPAWLDAAEAAATVADPPNTRLASAS